ncbi:ABC-three component system middle component 2 [Amycolatopsis japonica]|uniref:ABC-three component system middle component 2 n=1 Tax=Amycolatopsis japonica TaxID=208439 RepID=UPI00332AE4EE
MNPLNSPIEVGIRTVVLLSQLFPESADIGQLVLLDYGLIHSGDLGGPPSLLPDTPARPAEFGVKRKSITEGLQVMMRAGLVELIGSDSGFEYKASERAGSFLGLLEAPHVGRLRERAAWAVSNEAGIVGENQAKFRSLVASWSEEFGEPLHPVDGNGD